MRILHVISSLQVGGAERFVIDLAAHQQLTQKVTILSMSEPGETLQAEAEKLDIEVFCIPNSGAYLQIRAIRKLCSKFDIVHTHSSYALPRILLATRLSAKPLKLIYTRHNEMVLNNLKWKLTYWLACQLIERFVFVSEQAQAKFLTYYPEATKLSLTVLNGVAPLVRKVASQPGIHLGHVGRFIPLKSQHLLVESAALLPLDIQKKLTLHFFGTGPDLDSVKLLASKYTDNFTSIFHGHQTDRNHIYSTFDILIVTSETEGLSLAIIEALACKMPVIASNVGGNSELVKHQSNGLLYEYGDIQMLADRIAKMSESTHLISEYGEAGYDIYNKHFSIQACAQGYKAIYQQLNGLI